MHMKLNNISLPYPVLGMSDDIIPLLPPDSVSVELNEDVSNYNFTITLKFNNEDISCLIKDDKAEFSCEYECARTMLRCCKKTNEHTFKIEIPRQDINGRINFNCFVSVKKLSRTTQIEVSMKITRVFHLILKQSINIIKND